MRPHEQYLRHRQDATLLATLDDHLARRAGTSRPDERTGRITVRLPRGLAEGAVRAWRRDETDRIGDETPEQAQLRDQAAELALIGLAVEERGRYEGDELVVDLDPAALTAARRRAGRR